MKTFVRKFPEDHLKVPFDRGWGCGYVAIPVGHPWHGLEWDNAYNLIDIHGGVTFSQKAPKWAEKFGFDPECWVIGFDTAHYGDNLETQNEQYVLDMTNNLLKQCEDVVVKTD